MGLGIRSTAYVQDKFVTISFRPRDQLKPDVVCDVLGKVVQSNGRLDLSDCLEVYLNDFRIPLGNGKMAEKTTVGFPCTECNKVEYFRCERGPFVFGYCTYYCRG